MQQDQLMKIFDLLKIQGFKTPEEMFIVGYLMAHGGERYVLEIIDHDLNLLEKTKDLDFWLPHIKDDHNIHTKVCDEEIKMAKSILKTLLNTRDAEVPDWLKK